MNSDTTPQDLDQGEVTAVTGVQEMRDAVITLIDQASSALVIVSDRLNPQIYNEAELTEALRARLLLRRRLAVRIFVRQPRLALINSPRLIALARRMGSNFQLRVPDDDQNDRSSWIVADRQSMLYRPLCERLQGTLVSHSPIRVKDQLDQFEALWTNALPSIELREFRV